MSMTIFNDTTTTNLTASADADSPIPVCGILSANIYSGCCFQIHPVDSEIYNSLERHALDSISEATYPSLSNGNAYCHLSSISSESDFIEFNYLANGHCIDGYFKCNLNSFLVYSQENCNGPYTNYSLLSNSIYQNEFGNYSIEVVKIMNAKVAIVWLTTLPYSNAPIHLNGYSAWEIFGIIFSGVGTVGFILTFVYYTTKYLKQPILMNLWLVFTQSIWIIRCLATITFVYYNPPSQLASDWVTSIWCFSCVCTYMSAIISANLLLKILKIEHLKFKSGFLYIGITVIALFCAWPSFFYFLSYVFPDNTDIQIFYFALSDELYFGWEVFMFAFDLVPPTTILYKMNSICVSKFKSVQQDAFLWWKRTVITMLAVESINICIYICLFSMQYFSVILGSDVGIDSVWLIQLLNYFIHNAIILSLFESLKEMVTVFVVKHHADDNMADKKQISDSIQYASTVRQPLNP
ncbi:hypothetical protein HDV06_001429 [Boothiomyces sp. JEL0866]|nr:hypothetical protein HDV06_001429 [Boothiomyces sp. JEL0866]